MSSPRAEAWDLHTASSQRCCCLCNWARPAARSPGRAFPRACASELPGLQNVPAHAQGGWKGRSDSAISKPWEKGGLCEIGWVSTSGLLGASSVWST